MYKILIDTSKRYEKSIKLILKDNEIGSKFGDLDLVSDLQRLLRDHRVKVSDISEVSVYTGPGSFTGLKIGVTVANILNWGLGLKKINELVLPNYGKEPNITPKEESKNL